MLVINSTELPPSLTRTIGLNQKVPLTSGKRSRYINFDNAASTPAFESVFSFIQRFMPWYSSVHRGTGFKSQVSSNLYDQAHEIAADFVGANRSENTVIFTKNATEAMNKLSFRFPFISDSIVLTTEMEHHSNDLPWRDKAKTIHIKVTESGELDLSDLKTKLDMYKERVSLVCVSGASNVTGLVQPIHTIAEMVHGYGAKILVDAAQLAPHRKIDILPNDDLAHIDFLIFSAHKMYAPFGTGVLIGPRELFLESSPEYSGGGTVESVSLEDIVWAGLPDREEAGSPNVVGAIALAKAITELEKLGMDQIATHEQLLTSYALKKLRSIEGLTIYGNPNSERVGVISFNIAGFSHSEVATALSAEYGIGIRNGCFCAHPYVVKLLKLSDSEITNWRTNLRNGNKADMPGLIRISFGCYNTLDEIDQLFLALSSIVSRQSRFSNQRSLKSSSYQKLVENALSFM